MGTQKIRKKEEQEVRARVSPSICSPLLSSFLSLIFLSPIFLSAGPSADRWTSQERRRWEEKPGILSLVRHRPPGGILSKKGPGAGRLAHLRQLYLRLTAAGGERLRGLLPSNCSAPSGAASRLPSRPDEPRPNAQFGWMRRAVRAAVSVRAPDPGKVFEKRTRNFFHEADIPRPRDRLGL